MPNVNVTYADMQSAADQLKTGQQQIESDLARLKRLVDNLVAGGHVTDSSSRQFEASYAEFSSGGEGRSSLELADPVSWTTGRVGQGHADRGQWRPGNRSAP